MYSLIELVPLLSLLTVGSMAGVHFCHNRKLDTLYVLWLLCCQFLTRHKFPTLGNVYTNPHLPIERSVTFDC